MEGITCRKCSVPDMLCALLCSEEPLQRDKRDSDAGTAVGMSVTNCTGMLQENVMNRR